MVSYPNAVWFFLVGGLLVGIGMLIFLLPSPSDFTPPSVGITYPDEGARVTGVVDVGLYATDASGIARVELSLNCRQEIAHFTKPPYTTVWDTKPLAVKPYTLCVTAWDRAGLSSWATRNVNVVR